MLALTRKIGQSFLIGEDIEITIVDIQGDQARVAIKAPRSVKILRKELVQEIEEANKAAAIKTLDVEAIKKLLEE